MNMRNIISSLMAACAITPMVFADIEMDLLNEELPSHDVVIAEEMNLEFDPSEIAVEEQFITEEVSQ